MVTVSKNFKNNTKYFVMCKDCMFFYPQLHINGGDGYCNNPYLFKVNPHRKRYNSVYDSQHQCCGFSLQINADIKPDIYFNRDNSNDDIKLRKDI